MDETVNVVTVLWIFLAIGITGCWGVILYGIILNKRLMKKNEEKGVNDG